MKINWYLKRHHHDYYSIVEPFRENGKNRHNKIYYCGRLADDEIKRINYALEILKNIKKGTVNLEDVLFTDHWRFLDIAFVNFIWEQWDISKIFRQSDDKKVQTSDVAKILTIYRCLDPGSYLCAVEWYEKTALDRILHINTELINKSRIFRELDMIEDHKKEIENYLYRTLSERYADSFRYVFYDLTDSYFEGRNCELAIPGRTKSNGFQTKKIVLSLLVNSNGYPFAWDILEDYSADVNTIRDLSSKWKKQFKFADKKITLVFDRGMVSDENLKHLDIAKYIYITAIDKNQIPNLQNVNIERFDSINSENMIEQIQKMMFVKYDDKTYYENLGIVDGRRYILIFNPEMFVDEKNSREKLIARAKAYIDEENEALSCAEKSRNEETTRNKIDKGLKTIKAEKFIDYDLEPIAIKKQGKDINKDINTFRIIPKETDATREAIKKAKRTDGLWVIVTNNTGKEEGGKKLSEEDLICAYRDKNQIEQAFKDIKSFINLQPFNVWEPQHVRAHYTICVLSYLLNITVTNGLRKYKTDIRSSQKVYEILRDGIIGQMSLKNTDNKSLNLMQLQSQQKMILELFQCERIVEKKYLKSIGINY